VGATLEVDEDVQYAKRKAHTTTAAPAEQQRRRIGSMTRGPMHAPRQFWLANG